jgi:hypothetical protein
MENKEPRTLKQLYTLFYEYIKQKHDANVGVLCARMADLYLEKLISYDERQILAANLMRNKPRDEQHVKFKECNLWRKYNIWWDISSKGGKIRKEFIRYLIDNHIE